MSSISVNTITDASGGSTTSINGFTPSVSNMGGKNRIINGNFDIWQRGTSFSNPDNTYTADRFLVVPGGGTTGDTVSRQSFTAGQTDVPNEPSYFLRFSVGGTSANRVMHHRVEDVRTFAGQTCTLSFWAKASVAHTSTVEIQQNFGSGGSGSVTLSPVSYSMTTSWQKFTFTQTMPSIAGKTIGSSSYVYLAFIRSLGASSVDIDIAQMQFEAGSVATPFCPAGGGSYGQELALCQRYYYVLSAASNQNTFFSSTSGYTSTQALCVIPFSNTMRTNPSLVTSGTASDYRLIMGGSFLTCSSVPTMDQPNPNSANLIFTVSSGIVVGYGGQVLANNTTSAFLGFSAEL